MNNRSIIFPCDQFVHLKVLVLCFYLDIITYDQFHSTRANQFLLRGQSVGQQLLQLNQLQNNERLK